MADTKKLVEIVAARIRDGGFGKESSQSLILRIGEELILFTNGWTGTSDLNTDQERRRGEGHFDAAFPINEIARDFALWAEVTGINRNIITILPEPLRGLVPSGVIEDNKGVVPKETVPDERIVDYYHTKYSQEKRTQWLRFFAIPCPVCGEQFKKGEKYSATIRERHVVYVHKKCIEQGGE